MKTDVTYKDAVDNSRDCWNRYRDLPKWRWLARRRALRCAEAWGNIAKLLHMDPMLGSSDVQPPGTT